MPPLKRTLLALVLAPLTLAVVFVPFALHVATATGLEGDALIKAIEPVSPFPIAIGFSIIFFVTRGLAAKDGLSLRDLGWAIPQSRELMIALVTAAVVAAAAIKIAYPLIQQIRPAFDPTVPAISLPVASIMLAIATAAEDTLYRGFAFHQLGRRFGTPAALLATSLFYALIAPGQGWPLVLYAFGLGLVLSGLRLTTKSLPAVVLAHWLVSLAPKLIATF